MAGNLQGQMCINSQEDLKSCEHLLVRVQVPLLARNLIITVRFFCFVAMYTVYAIKSLSSNYVYKGLTSDLEERLRRHNAGLEKTTKPYCPFKLIYKKEFETRLEARNHEKYLKSGIGREFLKRYL